MSNRRRREAKGHWEATGGNGRAMGGNGWQREATGSDVIHIEVYYSELTVKRNAVEKHRL